MYTYFYMYVCVTYMYLMSTENKEGAGDPGIGVIGSYVPQY